ncbi:MAG: hypothetical protein VZQ47_03045 [Treponema sp.]|nr:hypothetical protein [Treponema sp.]MEE3434519.1 hypothetical protein [Treponema sp.]
MKSRFLIAGAVVALAIFSASAEEEQKQSTYKKLTGLLDSVAQKVGPAAKKIAESAAADAQQSIKDFADDLSAPEEEQSGFAKAFNKFCDTEPCANLGWHGDTGEKVPDGVFRGGRMEQ